jgi:hypothetical protein
MRMTEYGVNVPDDLLKQLEEEQVVLFLGAGISKLSPSNLPDFTKLTRDICKEANVPFSKNLSLDYNLSKVAKIGSGYDVHQRVIDKINPPSSKPNDWHETLLRWFGCANKVRIVTTNFDAHLSTAADNLKWSMPQYIAPVLPLGDDFQGIVYLHGRIDKKESIIVTGEDFGKAYLNYAWAARFLQAMFAKYTVIFIGYSNRDPLVRYLTSGLAVCTTNKHYAFTGSEAVRDWSELDIEPVLFEQSKERFTAMLHVAKDIAQQYCMTELEHETHMCDLLTRKDILLSPQDQDYLLRSLTKANRIKHFCRYATGEKWLRWLIKHIKEVQLLFDPFVKPEQSSRDYVEWIGGQCFEMANDLLLQEMVKLRLGSSLWLEISLVICYREVNITAERMTSWIYILLRDAVFPSHWEVLQDILLNNKLLTNSKTKWVIFSQLLKPIMQLNKNIIIESGLSERPVIANLTIRSNDPKELCEYWKKVLQSQLPDIHDQVQSLVTLYLTEAYYMLIEQGGWSREFDEVSCSRKTIVKEIDDSGYTHFEPMDPLLDAAVDLIQWYSAHKQEYLNRLITSWNDTSIPMLKRLSLYAVSYANWNDEEKCQWLINNKILEWNVYYNESYQLLSSIFINLSPVTKEKAIRVLLQVINHSATEGNLKHNRGIRTYYLLKNIIEKNGETLYLAAAMRVIKTLLEDAGIEYQPADLAKQPIVTDISVLLDGNIITALQRYDEIIKQNSFYNENKEIFESAFSEKATKELDWGISLIDILCQQDNENVYYLIGGLLRVLGAAELTQEQQMVIYQKIKRASKIEHIAHDVACFLKFRSKKGLDGYSQQLIDELLDCVVYVLDWAIDVSFEKEPGRRWLDAAINHPIGDLTFALLQVLSDHGKVEKYINASTEHLSSLLSHSNAAEIVEVICASQFHFLYAIAPDWATTKILPLFDWNKSKAQAERAWDGFLFWGRLTRNLIRPLMRHFVTAADFIELIDEERYCEYLAWLTMSRYIERPLASKALGSVLFKLNDQQRGRYFNYIRSRLSEIKDQHYSQWAWNNVLLPLLKARKHMTVGLGAGELMAILGWMIEFKDYCVPLMEKLASFSTVKIKECYQLNRFERTDLCDKYPEETAKLWIWLANRLTPGEASNGVYGGIAEILLANDKVSAKVKQQLAEALSGLGLSI